MSKKLLDESVKKAREDFLKKVKNLGFLVDISGQREYERMLKGEIENRLIPKPDTSKQPKPSQRVFLMRTKGASFEEFEEACLNCFEEAGLIEPDLGESKPEKVYGPLDEHDYRMFLKNEAWLRENAHKFLKPKPKE